MTIKQTVGQIYQGYENRELDKVLSAMSDDFRFDWPVDPKNVRFSGLCSGKGGFIRPDNGDPYFRAPANDTKTDNFEALSEF